MKRLLKLAVLPTLLVSLFSFSLLNSSSTVSTESVVEVKENIEVEKKEAVGDTIDVYLIVNAEDSDYDAGWSEYRLHMWGGTPEVTTTWPGQWLPTADELGGGKVFVFENVDVEYENYIVVKSWRNTTDVAYDFNAKPINLATQRLIEVYGWGKNETRVHNSIPTEYNLTVEVPSAWTAPNVHLYHESGLGTAWPGLDLAIHSTQIGSSNYYSYSGIVPFTATNVIISNGTTGSSESNNIELTGTNLGIRVLDTTTATKRNLELFEIRDIELGVSFVETFNLRRIDGSICHYLNENVEQLPVFIEEYNSIPLAVRVHVDAEEDTSGVTIGETMTYLIAQSTPTEVSINNIFGSVSEMNIVIVIIASILLGAGVVGFYYMNSKKKKYN